MNCHPAQRRRSTPSSMALANAMPSTNCGRRTTAASATRAQQTKPRESGREGRPASTPRSALPVRLGRGSRRSRCVSPMRGAPRALRRHGRRDVLLPDAEARRGRQAPPTSTSGERRSEMPRSTYSLAALLVVRVWQAGSTGAAVGLGVVLVGLIAIRYANVVALPGFLLRTSARRETARRGIRQDRRQPAALAVHGLARWEAPPVEAAEAELHSRRESRKGSVLGLAWRARVDPRGISGRCGARRARATARGAKGGRPSLP